MTEKPKRRFIAQYMADKVIESMGETAPDCTAEQLAVDLQTIIRDAARESYEDEESILGELLLALDDCQNQTTEDPPPPETP